VEAQARAGWGSLIAMAESNEQFAYRMRRKRGEPMDFRDHWVELMAANEDKWKPVLVIDKARECPAEFAKLMLDFELPDTWAEYAKAFA
jgi:hypothetical protein